LLILLCLIVRKFTNFDPGREQIQTLAKIVTYAIIINVFFFLCEVFVAFYSGIPEHMDHLKYLFFGLHGHNALVPWMWASMFLMLLAIILLLIPMVRKNEGDTGRGLRDGVRRHLDRQGHGHDLRRIRPQSLHHVTEYMPTIPELIITLGGPGPPVSAGRKLKRGHHPASGQDRWGGLSRNEEAEISMPRYSSGIRTKLIAIFTLCWHPGFLPMRCPTAGSSNPGFVLCCCITPGCWMTREIDGFPAMSRQRETVRPSKPGMTTTGAIFIIVRRKMTAFLKTGPFISR
jgi:hypothetical protein